MKHRVTIEIEADTDHDDIHVSAKFDPPASGPEGGNVLEGTAVTMLRSVMPKGPDSAEVEMAANRDIVVGG